MSFQQAATHLNEVAWTVAQYRGWVITIAVLAGVLWPWLRTRPPALSMCVHNGAVMLTGAATAVTISTLLHFTDLRWLPPGQHPAAPTGFLSDLAKPFITVADTAAAAKVSIHTALVFAAIAVTGYLMARLSRRPARRAAEKVRVRVQVREQVQPLAARLAVVERALLAASPEEAPRALSHAPQHAELPSFPAPKRRGESPERRKRMNVKLAIGAACMVAGMVTGGGIVAATAGSPSTVATATHAAAAAPAVHATASAPAPAPAATAPAPAPAASPPKSIWAKIAGWVAGALRFLVTGS